VILCFAGFFCLQMRGTVDTILLTMIIQHLQQVNNTLSAIFKKVNRVERQTMSIERLFALEKIPQEIENKDMEYRVEVGRIEF